MLEVFHMDQVEQWDEVVRSFDSFDIYYLCGYSRVSRWQLGGVPYLLFYHNDSMKAINVVFLRDVAQDAFFAGKIEPGKYFDLVTPYGYGGWLVEGEGDCEDMFCQYACWCREQGVISEFVRLHPIFNNYKWYTQEYAVEYSRKTVGTNLADFEDPVHSEFGKSTRRDIRHAENAGISCTVYENQEDWSDFRDLYNSTMERNHAEEAYYFNDEYYNELKQHLKCDVIEIRASLNGETIGCEMYFIAGNLMHAHLLGSNDDFLRLRGGALMEATAARWGKEHGYRYIHHGGGRTSAPDDPLYAYKRKFGKHTEFDFYTGKKIWNPDRYQELVAIKESAYGETLEGAYFPLYRLTKHED